MADEIKKEEQVKEEQKISLAEEPMIQGIIDFLAGGAALGAAGIIGCLLQGANLTNVAWFIKPFIGLGIGGLSVAASNEARKAMTESAKDLVNFADGAAEMTRNVKSALDTSKQIEEVKKQIQG